VGPFGRKLGHWGRAIEVTVGPLPTLLLSLPHDCHEVRRFLHPVLPLLNHLMGHPVVRNVRISFWALNCLPLCVYSTVALRISPSTDNSLVPMSHPL
jgi:hypothetical protein